MVMKDLKDVGIYYSAGRFLINYQNLVNWYFFFPSFFYLGGECTGGLKWEVAILGNSVFFQLQGWPNYILLLWDN